MPRAIAALIATVAGLVLLLSFHTTPEPAPLVVATPSESPLPAGTSTPRSTVVESTTTTTLPAGPPREAACVSNEGGELVVDGPTDKNEYGDVKVRVHLALGSAGQAGTQITEVEALVLPSGSSKTDRITQLAGPRLRLEVLQAQSANIDTVSGATVTSAGYRFSLQRALDFATSC